MSGIAHPTPAQSSGGAGEDRAAAHLERHGLRIVGRNYRVRMGEIDLIAMDGATLVFVEVRVRRDGRYGGAAASVDFRKQQRLVAAARHYLMRLSRTPPCRFDVVTLQGDAVEWLRGAFDAG